MLGILGNNATEEASVREHWSDEYKVVKGWALHFALNKHSECVSLSMFLYLKLYK